MSKEEWSGVYLVEDKSGFIPGMVKIGKSYIKGGKERYNQIIHGNSIRIEDLKRHEDLKTFYPEPHLIHFHLSTSNSEKDAFSVEKSLLEIFESLRIPGTKELFRKTPELLYFARLLSAENNLQNQSYSKSKKIKTNKNYLNIEVRQQYLSFLIEISSGILNGKRISDYTKPFNQTKDGLKTLDDGYSTDIFNRGLIFNKDKSLKNISSDGTYQFEASHETQTQRKKFTPSQIKDIL